MNRTLSYDPTNIIEQAMEMEGLDREQCRTIFLSWALGLEDVDIKQAASFLCQKYAAQHPNHDLIKLLSEASQFDEQQRNRKKRSS